VLRITPGARDVLRMRGESFFALNLWEQAIQDFDELIRSNPRDAEIVEKRGLCHLQLRHWDTALADFDCVVLLDPTDPDGYGERARVYAAQGKHAEAFRELERCRKLNTEVAKYHEKLAYPNGRPKP
jgi:tetratricopeptide (TPR) repeat protein